MRTLIFANSLSNTGKPTAKGELGIVNALGNGQNITSGQTIPAGVDTNAMIELLMSAGNTTGFKNFSINPLHFNFVTQLSGYSGEVAHTETITFKTGNVSTQSMGQYFNGGVVLQKRDSYKNIYNDVALIPVTVEGSSGVVAASAVVSALTIALASYIGAGKFFTSADYGDSSKVVLTYGDANYQISLTGDLRSWDSATVQGMSYINSGKQLAAFERETMPNSGYSNTIDKNEGFNASNFIADTTKNYHLIQITSISAPQRPLIHGSGGFPTACTIAVPTDQKTAVFDVLVNFLTKLKTNGIASFTA